MALERASARFGGLSLGRGWPPDASSLPRALLRLPAMVGNAPSPG